MGLLVSDSRLTTDNFQMAAWEFQSLQNIADKNGWHKFISMQNYYNLIYREEGTSTWAIQSYCSPVGEPLRLP